MQVVPFAETDSDEWDQVVAKAQAGTFIHTRRFLSYHRNRFDDCSVFVKNDKQEVLGVLPAAIDPSNQVRVVSHPGITFGGLLHDGNLAGDIMIEAIECLRSYYLTLGMETVSYKAVPYIYHRRPASDDLYALFRLNAVRTRCDLSSTIDLANQGVLGSRRKRSLTKSRKAGVEVVRGADFADELWEVITDNLERKLGEKPVHSVEEIKYLSSLFPENIKFIVGRLNGQTIAGITLFCSDSVVRAQYIASSPAGYEVSALDTIFEYAINEARNHGRRYFDFGTSNRNEGRYLSQSLYQFKSEFGGGGVAHEYYDLGLTAQNERVEDAVNL